jgi:para-aminobenzoate synthetase/4-amino-4-deoxychorismate lyase
MKGTFKRGKDIKEDQKNILKLKSSLKDRSENLMIVDLLRNDFGRISEAGSVKTQELFKVEKYETLLQMISIIKAKLKKDISLNQLLKSVFPCGSVTGAPKIRAMQIIRDLEKEPRGIYTGSIGYLTPNKNAVFNVAIRTLVLDAAKKKAEMGIGSGIVYDSEAENEFQECLLKADFTKKTFSGFKLIETLLVKKNKKVYLLGYHLKRLNNSLKYFDFCYNEGVIKDKLQRYLKKLDNSKIYKLRLLHSKNGSLIIRHSPLEKNPAKNLKVAISKKRVNSSEVFLYHKTTNRALYDAEYKKAVNKGLAEIIFLNEYDQVTEGAISNIIIKKKNYYYTPPISCGLLNGVYRQYLINKNNFFLEEKIIYKKDLLKADKVFICNSLRGLREVKLISG